MFGKGWAAVGEDTDNRFLLVNFCRANDLLVANTWYQQPAAKQATSKEPGTHWLPPANAIWDPADFAQLDFCLVPRRWRNSCKHIHSQPRANLDSDHFPSVVCLQIKLGARRKLTRRPRWEFQQATTAQIDAMNGAIDTMLTSMRLHQDPTGQWGALSTLYTQAIDQHIPKQTLQPKQPWFTQTTLNLLERRGQIRLQGDLAQVAELNKAIKKAAKLDKPNWLDVQLSTGDWRPITNLKKPFPHRALTLTDNSVSGQAASNAEVFATHLATRQWQEAGPSQGLDTATIYSNPPTISEATISIDEVKLAVKQAKAAK